MTKWLLAVLITALGACPMLAQAQDLALKRVMLSSGGLGYFEYEAAIDGDATLKLTVGLDQVDDVLKSLVVYDDKGGIGGLSLPGREPLKQAFKDDPYDVITFNTLELFDRFEKDYTTVETDKFTIRLHKKEAPASTRYVTALLDEARAKLTKK